jgi:hypothetical protein
MAQISSLKLATGVFGAATLLKISMFALAVALLGSMTPAKAGSLGQPCTDAPREQWLSVETLRGKAEALGYRVQSAKLKNACGELYAFDKTGKRVELFVDPTNGHIVGQI